MRAIGNVTWTSLLFCMAALLGACLPADGDGANESFLGPGAADSFDGVENGSALGQAVLRLVSDASFETLSSPSEVGLGSRAAGNIVDARSGPDGEDGTQDDVPFETLEQLDAVPYVGPRTLEKLVAYVEDRGLVSSGNHLEAQAANLPWSGYWWSMLEGELVLGWEDGQGRARWTEEQVRAFDECLPSYEPECLDLFDTMVGQDAGRLSPLMKFDWYVRMLLEEQHGPGGAPYNSYSHASRWELDHHYIGDNQDHRYWDARGYSGKCIGWALSTFDYPEPAADVAVSGVLFRPADIKGLLAAIYNGAQFFVPEDAVMGNAYHNVEGANLPEHYEDVHPHELVRALFATIGQGTLLEADMDPGDGVWNYPLYRYEIDYAHVGPTVVAVEARVFYANDEVEIDDVFSTDPNRPDLLSRALTFELDLPENWDGDLASATSGRWTGASVDDHPDALILGIEEGWRETIYEYRSSQMNEEVNFQLIKRARGTNGWEPVVDWLLAAYFG